MSYGRREPGDEEPLPKPYDFVPLPPGGPDLRPPAGHHRLRVDSLSGELSATLIVRSALHVASGLLEPRPNARHPLVKAHFRSSGQPTIPATSLKGCIRSIVEAITRSAVQVTQARELRPSRSLDSLDPAQRLFGTMGYQGQVRFSDAPLLAGGTTIIETPQLHRPHPESFGTYYEGTRPKGRKFYMHGKVAELAGGIPLEVCPADSRLALRIAFDGLSSGELGLLLVALGLGADPLPRLWPKLGGGKPICLGTLEVSEPQLRIATPRESYHDFDAIEALIAPADLTPHLAAALTEGLLAEPQLRALAAILRWPREDRDCPPLPY